MGRRLLANTLVSLAAGNALAPGQLQQVVFAAPDIDAETSIRESYRSSLPLGRSDDRMNKRTRSSA
jgi:esterase/lipase superfamily enzyme